MMTAALQIGTRVRTIDRGAHVHGRAPDKPEAIGIIRDHHRPYGRHSKERTPPYYVTFETGEAAWYDASEVEPIRGSRSPTKATKQKLSPQRSHATKKSTAEIEREIKIAVGPGPRPKDPREISFDPRCFVEGESHWEYVVMPRPGSTAYPKRFRSRADAEALARRTGGHVVEERVTALRRIRWK